MTFSELGLMEALLKALADQEYETPTPIQTAAIPPGLLGRDIMGTAQTGTGKTASFALPILQRLAAGKRGRIRALVVAPTRELAVQIRDNFQQYGKYLKLETGMVIGGVGMRPQDDMLRRGVDILVATPGRLLDHLEKRTADLRDVETVVLDEADRMLDMGFIRDIRRIFRYLPAQHQTMLFSATLPAEIQKLAQDILHDPIKVETSRRSSTPTSVQQIVHPCTTEQKRPVLLALLDSPGVNQVIVFARTKWGANKLSLHLERHGHSVAAIHGNKSQAQRQSALERFRDGRVRVLVATDIAARGLDVEGVSHVINFEIPNVPEDYVHRIGRTGRASAVGTAISLMCDEERPYIRNIERLTGKPLLHQVFAGLPARTDVPSLARPITTVVAGAALPAAVPAEYDSRRDPRKVRQTSSRRGRSYRSA